MGGKTWRRANAHRRRIRAGSSSVVYSILTQMQREVCSNVNRFVELETPYYGQPARRSSAQLRIAHQQATAAAKALLSARVFSGRVSILTVHVVVALPRCATHLLWLQVEGSGCRNQTAAPVCRQNSAGLTWVKGRCRTACINNNELARLLDVGRSSHALALMPACYVCSHAARSGATKHDTWSTACLVSTGRRCAGLK